MTSEFDVLRALTPRLGRPPTGEVWAGDDCAVLGDLVVTVDPVVDGVHVDRSIGTIADAGWKLAARNVSDVVAMGATPWRAFVSLVGATPDEVTALYDGVLAAAAHWGFAVAGGDLAGGPGLVATMTLLGRLDGPPLLRSGAAAGDHVWLHVPGGGGLGRGASGLRLLRSGRDTGDAVRWFRRPEPLVAAGRAAAAAGASAAIDISDGLLSDLAHVAEASGVGFALVDVPIADGATREEALQGGDEYALLFTAPPAADVAAAFAAVGPVSCIGTCVADPAERTVDGAAVAAAGWSHDL